MNDAFSVITFETVWRKLRTRNDAGSWVHRVESLSRSNCPFSHAYIYIYIYIYIYRSHKEIWELLNLLSNYKLPVNFKNHWLDFTVKSNQTTKAGLVSWMTHFELLHLKLYGANCGPAMTQAVEYTELRVCHAVTVFFTRIYIYIYIEATRKFENCWNLMSNYKLPVNVKNHWLDFTVKPKCPTCTLRTKKKLNQTNGSWNFC
mgnify:CR=1 FL=1